MLKLSPYDFDQTDKGWRRLSQTQECNAAAADLIAAYRKSNWRKLDEGWLKMSYWHEGQARAIAGQNDLAIPLLLASAVPANSGEQGRIANALSWAEYGLATVAFLHHDLEALKAARARLAALPVPLEWKEVVKDVPAELQAAAKWPPNLNKVDGLIACFDKPYAEAYGCEPKR